MTTRRHPNVVNRDEVAPRAIDKGKHHFVRRSFTDSAGNRQLGGSLVELPPGAIAYPMHYHCANEEAIFIISGTGTARIGDQRIAVRAGDWIAYPVGRAHAHQMINDSGAPLVYLAVSTDIKTEVIGYPESNKLAAWGGDNWDKPWLQLRTHAGDGVDYWDGEPTAK